MDVLVKSPFGGIGSESPTPTPITFPANPLPLAGGAGIALDGLGRSGLAQRQESFASVLSRADHRPGAKSRTEDEKLHDAAEQFVSITFLQPVLKQLRSSSLAAEGPFKPSAAEKQFQSLYDADLAQRLVKSSNWPLVDRIAEDLKKAAAGKGAPAIESAEESKP